MPEVRILHTPGCATSQITVQRVRTLVAELCPGSVVTMVNVALDLSAMVRFAGSPTVLVDGVDLEPDVSPVHGFA